MKRTKLLAFTALLLSILPFTHHADATIYLDWVDEFVGGTLDCASSSDSAECITINRWNGTSQTGPYYWQYPNTWQFIGNQGANATGRANAREKIMFRFRDNRTEYSWSATANLARYRTTSPGALDSTCGGGTYVGSVSHTVTSTVFQPADYLYFNRMLPVFNFSAETAGPGTVVGYRTNLTATIEAGGTPASISQSGCYKINWSN